MLDVNTRNARCSSTMDEVFICDRVDNSGGFERLDKEIFQFRVSMLLEQAEEEGYLRSLTKSITKMENRLESAGSSSFASSSSSWNTKFRAHKRPWLVMTLASIACGGVIAAALAVALAVAQSRQSSNDTLPDTSVETQSLPTTSAATTTVTTTSFDNYYDNGGYFPPSTEEPSDNGISSGGTKTTTEVSTTLPPIEPVTPGPDSQPDHMYCLQFLISGSPDAIWEYNHCVSTTTGSPDSISAGGQSTTADEQEQTSPWGDFSLMTDLILVSGAAALLLSLMLLALVMWRRWCSDQGGAVEQGTARDSQWHADVDQGTAGLPLRQNFSRRVQRERLKLLRQMAEERLHDLDRETGIASV